MGHTILYKDTYTEGLQLKERNLARLAHKLLGENAEQYLEDYKFGRYKKVTLNT
jgi:hypothetical protein